MTDDEMVAWHHQLNGHEFEYPCHQGTLPWACLDGGYPLPWLNLALLPYPTIGIKLAEARGPYQREIGVDVCVCVCGRDNGGGHPGGWPALLR